MTRITPEQRIAHFSARLAFETDVSDVRAEQLAGPEFTLVAVRSLASWSQGRARGAVHMPRQHIATRAPAELDPGVPVVVYCWGPGCNGAHKAALAFAQLGYEVREMIGGFEYWAREGMPVDDEHGDATRPVDPLTSPVGSAGAGPHCSC